MYLITYIVITALILQLSILIPIKLTFHQVSSYLSLHFNQLALNVKNKFITNSNNVIKTQNVTGNFINLLGNSPTFIKNPFYLCL